MKTILALILSAALAGAETISTNTLTPANILSGPTATTTGTGDYLFLLQNGAGKKISPADFGASLTFSSGQVSGLSVVATSGSYADLLGTPAALPAAGGTAAFATAIPTASQIATITGTDTAAAVTPATLLGREAQLSALPKLLSTYASGTAPRVVLFGDSFADNANGVVDTYFKNSVGVAGYTLGAPIGVVASGGAAGGLNMALSISGGYHTLPPGGSLTWSYATVFPVPADSWKVFTGPGECTFTLTTTTSGTAAITGTYSTSGTGVTVFSGTYSSPLPRSMTVTGVSGTGVFYGVEMVNTTASGVIIGNLARGGLDMNTMTVPDSISAPLLAAIAPTVVVYSMADRAADINTYLPGWMDKFAAASAPDWLFVGTHPHGDGTSDPDTRDINAALKTLAKSRGCAFFDPCVLFGDYTQIRASGLMSDYTHLNNLGDKVKFYTAFNTSGAGLLPLVREAGRTSGAFYDLKVKSLGNTASGVFGRNDPVGIPAVNESVTFNDNNAPGLQYWGTQAAMSLASGTLTLKIPGAYPTARAHFLRNKPTWSVPTGSQFVVGDNGPSLESGTSAPGTANSSGGSFKTGSLFFQDTTPPALLINVASGNWQQLATWGHTAVSGTTYTQLWYDRIIGVTGGNGANVVLLSATSVKAGHTITIKDEGGNAAAAPIVLTGTVDGQVNPTAISTNYGVRTLFSSGSTWFFAN